MSIYAGTGRSLTKESFQAGKEACEHALAFLQERTGNPPDLALVFASSSYNQEELLAGVRDVVSCKLIGSSTAGEITNDGVAMHSVGVMLLSGNDVDFFTGRGGAIKTHGAFEAGKIFADNITQQAREQGKELSSVMMLPDVLVGNGADIVRGALDTLGSHFPLVGGASGDNQKFKKTFQYFNDEVLSGSLVGLGLSGDISFGIGVRHGWVPIGLPMKVTKSTGSKVEHIDGKPALAVYEDYFGEEHSRVLKNSEHVSSTQSVLTYPFGISQPGHEEILIRFATNIESDGSITCAAEIPEGSDIRLMIGSKERAVEAARIAAQQAVDDLDGKEPKAAIIFNCIARHNLFGQEAKEEIQAIQEVIGEKLPLLGFYTYGEQAPINGITRNIEKCETSFHNETVVIYLLA